MDDKYYYYMIHARFAPDGINYCFNYENCIPSRYITKELIDSAAKNLDSLKNIPKKFIDRNVCDKLIANNYREFENIPQEYKNIDDIFRYIKICPKVTYLMKVSEIKNDPRIPEYIINNVPGCIGSLPDKYKTEELFYKVLKSDANLLSDLFRNNSEKINREIIKFAAENGCSLQHIIHFWKLPDDEIIYECCNHNPSDIQFLSHNWLKRHPDIVKYSAEKGYASNHQQHAIMRHNLNVKNDHKNYKQTKKFKIIKSIRNKLLSIDQFLDIPLEYLDADIIEIALNQWPILVNIDIYIENLGNKGKMLEQFARNKLSEMNLSYDEIPERFKNENFILSTKHVNMNEIAEKFFLNPNFILKLDEKRLMTVDDKYINDDIFKKVVKISEINQCIKIIDVWVKRKKISDDLIIYAVMKHSKIARHIAMERIGEMCYKYLYDIAVISEIQHSLPASPVKFTKINFDIEFF